MFNPQPSFVVWSRAPRSLQRAAGAVVAVASLSCGGGGGDSHPTAVNPAPSVRALSIVQSKSATDTIGALIAQPLIVEVRDPATGALRTGAAVRFEAVDSAQATGETLVARVNGTTFSRVAIDTTDATGRARASVRLGTIAGNRRVVATFAAASSADTATFTTTPGAPFQFRAAPIDTAVIIGHTYTQSATATDRAGNATAVTVRASSATPDICTVDANGTVHGITYGFCTVNVAFGATSALARARVLPDGLILVRRGASIGTLSLDGSGFTKLADVDTLNTAAFQWLKSGREVAAFESDGTSGSHLAIFSLDGTKRTFPSLPFSPGRQRVSADATWIASVNRIPDPTMPLDPASVVRIRQDGTGVQVVGEQCCTYVLTATDISPDGTRIAYGDFQKGFVANLGGGRGSTIGPIQDVRFSPDGTQLATVAQNRLFVGPVDGTKRFVAGNIYTFLSIAGWSPDGNWVLVDEFVSPRLYWYAVNVNDLSVLTLPLGVGTTYALVGGWKP